LSPVADATSFVEGLVARRGFDLVGESGPSAANLGDALCVNLS
jgi:hypothetical protein